VSPGVAVYTEHGGSLYYSGGSTVEVAPGGAVYLVASPILPGLRALAGTGEVEHMTGVRVADYLVWRIRPGGTILGVRVVSTAGPRPLGTGIAG
jgi:hypothetical protein